jgi:hypothetical protein
MSDRSVITRESMFEPLLAADPSFAPSWTAFSEEWDGEGDQPLYLALVSLAHHLIGRLKAGDTSNFAAVFDVIEEWHLRGDAYVREAASIGLLEDLQNTNLHDGTEPVEFEPWLRSESKLWWKKLDRFWSKGEPLSSS